MASATLRRRAGNKLNARRSVSQKDIQPIIRQLEDDNEPGGLQERHTKIETENDHGNGTEIEDIKEGDPNMLIRFPSNENDRI